MTANYTLFRPTGEALRAKVDLELHQLRHPDGGGAAAQRSSPDMTHTVRVRAGDTLPLLCQKIYRDASKYLEIARLNDLDGFRALAPGSGAEIPADAMSRLAPCRQRRPGHAEIKSNGSASPTRAQVLSVATRAEMFRIPEAVIVLEDGDPASSDFPLADGTSSCPAPRSRSPPATATRPPRPSSRASWWRCG